jgi:hypothetical protein
MNRIIAVATRGSKMDSERFREYARAAYRGTEALYQFIQDRILPLLQHAIGRSEYEEALVGLYYRSHLLLRSLVKLDGFDDVQAVRSIARTLFELLLDMKTLQREPILAKRFAAFATVERMRTAIRVADFASRHPMAHRRNRFKHQIALATDPARIKQCEDMLLNVYGIRTDILSDRDRKFPKSWSKMDVRAQASKVGDREEETYLSKYCINSWFIHGGFAGLEGISEEGLINAYGLGHLLSQESCHDSTRIIGKELRLFDAQTNLSSDLESIKRVPFEAFLGGMIEKGRPK